MKKLGVLILFRWDMGKKLKFEDLRLPYEFRRNVDIRQIYEINEKIRPNIDDRWRWRRLDQLVCIILIIT